MTTTTTTTSSFQWPSTSSPSLSLRRVYQSLPMDLIHHILSYNESIVLRNGIYMNRISKEDPRLQLPLLQSSSIEYVEIRNDNIIFLNCVYQEPFLIYTVCKIKHRNEEIIKTTCKFFFVKIKNENAYLTYSFTRK